ncbi:MAG: hypothetical protein M1825_003925 [Sarcosagium campestre]|nr:MAG: hypothetical protein M1825_003925 [Sarcosagium campestre]
MAFRQPTQQPRRRQSPNLETSQDTTPLLRQQPIEDSQEWVLFSPVAPSTIFTQTTSTERTTHPDSILSDFGSLDTAGGRSERLRPTADGPEPELETRSTDLARDDAGDDDEGELDSLDSHLHAFREPATWGGSLLPTHDGLGMFPASNLNVQEHLYRFEQYNPERHVERPDHRGPSEQDVDSTKDLERTNRIQEWRMEQSRILLAEIERESRRRRASRTRDATPSLDRGQANAAKTSASPRSRSESDGAAQEDLQSDPTQEEEEPFWRRITRRVIRDIIGIDEPLLSVILGESLPGDSDPPSASVRKDGGDEGVGSIRESSPVTWEDRFLARIARELGKLVNQMASHPGAFSTFQKTQEMPDYAGMGRPTARIVNNHSSSNAYNEHWADSMYNGAPGAGTPVFTPTIPRRHVNQWGVEEDNDDDYDSNLDANANNSTPVADSTASHRTEEERIRREREYWERELDVGMIFSFLRNRFRRAENIPSESNFQSLIPQTTSSTAQARARRAAVIRQQHPLVQSPSNLHPRGPTSAELYTAGTGSIQPRSWTSQSPGPPPPLLSALKRPSSSGCASQSTKSKRGKSSAGGGGGGGGGSSSSRNYWDIGASVGSGSVSVGAAASAGLGAWGEV